MHQDSISRHKMLKNRHRGQCGKGQCPAPHSKCRPVRMRSVRLKAALHWRCYYSASVKHSSRPHTT